MFKSSNVEHRAVYFGNKTLIWRQYDSMIDVELRGVHMMGSAYLYMVHVYGTTQGLHAVLLRLENV